MINISLSYIHCDEETDEIGADEPYVLAVAVALTPSVEGAPVQIPIASDVVVYPFENMRTGSRPAFGLFESFWGIGGVPTSLPDPNEAIFLVAMMENDNGDPQLARGIVDGVVTASLATSFAVPRAGKVTTLMHDVDSGARTPTGGPNFDDAIGRIRSCASRRMNSSAPSPAKSSRRSWSLKELADVTRSISRQGIRIGWDRSCSAVRTCSRGATYARVPQQSESVLVALTVDKHGAMNVAWTDLNNAKGWQGPVAFGDAHLQPGAFITPLFKQSETVFAALTIDKHGAMNVVWAGQNHPGGWQGPVAFGGTHLQPGAFITPLFRQSETVFAALTVDRHGAMNVVWADQNHPGGGRGRSRSAART